MTSSYRGLTTFALMSGFTLAFAPLAACSDDARGDNGTLGDVGDTTPPGNLVGSDGTPDGGAGDGSAWPVGTKVRTTADLNLRDAPSTSGAILRVIPAGSLITILDATPQNHFWNVEVDSVRGWSSGTYLVKDGPTAPPATGSVDGASTPENALLRARSVVGFSYWWGGGAWLPTGVTAATAGSCTGNCGACSHGGQYGADCSGMVAKAWQYGNKDMTVSSHPYSTSVFISAKAGYWSIVSRDVLKPGDALVHSDGSSGHIVLFEKGDGWGASTVFECKGCSYGCVHDTRTFTTNYVGIRRAGF